MTNTQNSAETILDEVRNVISHAFHGKRTTPAFVTAYNVLNRLPETTRTQLIEQHGLPGRGEGNNHPASQVVKDALLMLHRNEEVAIDFIDSFNDTTFKVGDETITPGNDTVAIYRFVGTNKQ